MGCGVSFEENNGQANSHGTATAASHRPAPTTVHFTAAKCEEEQKAVISKYSLILIPVVE